MNKDEYIKEFLAQCLSCANCKRGKKVCEVNQILRRGRQFWEDDTMYRTLVIPYLRDGIGKCRNFKPNSGVLSAR